jgi:hypothetical protein
MAKKAAPEAAPEAAHSHNSSHVLGARCVDNDGMVWRGFEGSPVPGACVCVRVRACACESSAWLDRVERRKGGRAGGWVEFTRARACARRQTHRGLRLLPSPELTVSSAESRRANKQRVNVTCRGVAGVRGPSQIKSPTQTQHRDAHEAAAAAAAAAAPLPPFVLLFVIA